MYDLVLIKHPDGLITINELSFSQLCAALKGCNVPESFWSFETEVETHSGIIALLNPDGPMARNIYRVR